MIELTATQDDITKAKQMADEMGVIRNSIEKGGGSPAGFLAEIVVARHLGAIQFNTYQYDLITLSGDTIDVKAKRTRVPPKPYYECSIAAYNTKQRCDYYAFCRVLNDLRVVWLLGIISKAEYFKKATKRLKGEYDSNNDFTFKVDCYNLPISELPNKLIK